MHEINRFDPLHEHQVPINRMFSRDDGSIATKPSQRDMRSKRSVVRLPKGEKKNGAQFRDVLPGRAFRPQKARTLWLRTVADMPKFQGERVKPIGHATKLPDSVRYRNLVPRRHQREMNVGRGDETNWKWLETPRHLRELVGNLGRDLESDKNSCQLRTACVCSCAISLIRAAF